MLLFLSLTKHTHSNTHKSEFMQKTQKNNISQTAQTEKKTTEKRALHHSPILAFYIYKLNGMQFGFSRQKDSDRIFRLVSFSCSPSLSRIYFNLVAFFARKMCAFTIFEMYNARVNRIGCCAHMYENEICSEKRIYQWERVDVEKNKSIPEKENDEKRRTKREDLIRTAMASHTHRLFEQMKKNNKTQHPFG